MVAAFLLFIVGAVFSFFMLMPNTLRVTIEHDAPIAYGDRLEVLVHVYPPGSTDKFGPELTDRTVRTLTYLVGDETKSVASIFPI